MSNSISLPQVQGQTREKPSTERPWLWNVVLLNDDHHTYDFVIRMLGEVFAHPETKGRLLAKRVDKDGRAVVLTTHKELAELKQEQIHSFGRDKLIAESAGSMSAIIEPAEFGGEEPPGSGGSGGSGSSESKGGSAG